MGAAAGVSSGVHKRLYHNWLVYGGGPNGVTVWQNGGSTTEAPTSPPSQTFSGGFYERQQLRRRLLKEEKDRLPPPVAEAIADVALRETESAAERQQELIHELDVLGVKAEAHYFKVLARLHRIALEQEFAIREEEDQAIAILLASIL